MLPLLLLVAGATIQICHRIHVAKMLHLATYEAVRAGGSFGGDLDLAQRVFDDRTAAFGIEGAKFLPITEFDKTQAGGRISADSEAPLDPNSLLPGLRLSFANKIHGGEVMYLKEGFQGQ